MLKSMTAFARESLKAEWGQAVWELRSVNHRYLDISTRLPESWRGLEIPIRECIRKQLSRGKIEAQLWLESQGSEGLEIDLNRLEQIKLALKTVSSQLGHASSVDVLSILRWPGILKSPELNQDEIHQTLMKLFEQTLASLVAAREREGAQLQQLIETRLSAVSEQIAVIRPRVPLILDAMRQRLLTRARELQSSLSEDRLQQEMVIFAQRLDIGEELDRLSAHIITVKKTMEQSDAQGRRLDFLMQELNREANTIGAKSVDWGASECSVDIKVLIEQMREQIQNIE